MMLNCVQFIRRRVFGALKLPFDTHFRDSLHVKKHTWHARQATGFPGIIQRQVVEAGARALVERKDLKQRPITCYGLHGIQNDCKPCQRNLMLITKKKITDFAAHHLHTMNTGVRSPRTCNVYAQ